MQRKVEHILKSKPTLEGAGVKLKRVFGFREVPMFDPFLLLDHFGSRNPEDYIRGFPWHPHRGIETVTYMLAGEVEHGDSIGNRGIIRSGDVQWMTAGSGIIHQEMPQRYDGLMEGFQLWVNLPSARKMMGPRYRGIESDKIPVLEKEGVKIKIIAGKINDVKGPVKDLAVDVEYLHVEIQPETEFVHKTMTDARVFAYVVEGSGYFADELIESRHCVLFGRGESVRIRSEDKLNFLLVSGKPINEPVAWGGPIVMNTQDELEKAFRDLREGTFIKDSRPVEPSTDFYRS